MKKLLILNAVTLLALSAQAPEALAPPLTGVSESFRTYAGRNLFAAFSTAADGEDAVNPNQLYIPRLTANAPLSRIAAPLAVTAAPSSMFNQTTGGTLPVTMVGNFAGLGAGFNASWTNQNLLPPDTTLAVGNNQIVQWVNLRVTVLDKANGASLLGGSGFVTGNQVWAGLPVTSVCRNQNQGDPVLQYDRMANRWVLSQFAFGTATATATPFRVFPAAPYALCLAVSQTNDATGTFNLQEFTLPALPDYPKLGVWTDAYYLTSNDFSFSTVTGLSTYIGSRVCGFDRSAILLGSPAGGVCFSGLAADHFAMLPGDFEGTLIPPANAAEYVISTDWFTKNAPPYVMELRRFKPDFVTPANSTLNDGLGGATDSFVAMPFDNSVIGSCNDNGGQCVPQPGTVRVLDSLSMRPMYRLAYRNLGANREVLVFTASITPQTGTAAAGVQMVEIRNPSANPPSIFNNVNFNPDSTSRWMAAAATDKLGNIALGYSVSSATVNPGIRIAGRLRNDIRSTLRGEINVQLGAAGSNQTSTAQRWGDYSTMQIDPADDCTFWYTQEYTSSSSSANWATRIIGFKFNSCQ
jgi:hypothetical protein